MSSKRTSDADSQNERLMKRLHDGRSSSRDEDQVVAASSSTATMPQARSRPPTQVNAYQGGSHFEQVHVIGDGSRIGNFQETTFHMGPSSLSAAAEKSVLEIRERQGDAILDQIPYAHGAAFNDHGQQAKMCVDSTREDLLREIRDWAGDPNNSYLEGKLGFWLRGMAGTGKSTVARTVAEHCFQAGFAVASFFFRRGGGDLANSTTFVTTVLKQLAREDDLREPLTRAFHRNRGDKKQLEYEWRNLIQKPLSSTKSSRAIMLVIDAVDESEGSGPANYEMFDFLSDDANFKHLNIRIFVTSRPRQEEANIHQLFILHNVPPEVVEEDIRRFLKFEFGKLRKSAPRRFPNDEHIQQLARRCTPLFISARTSLIFIKELDRDFEARFNQLMSRTKGKDFEEDLDHMYLVVIKEALLRQGHSRRRDDNIRKNLDNFQRLVGSIIALREPADLKCLAVLLGVDPDPSLEYLKEFQAVLDIPTKNSGTIRTFHQSFPDFLSTWGRVEITCVEHNRDNDSEQSINPRDLWINEKISNYILFEGCMDVVEGRGQDFHGLKEDICDVKGPGTRVRDLQQKTFQEKLPSALRYSCRYWAMHFVLSSFKDELCERLLQFLKRHLLHWIEAMSWLGNLDDAIRQLDQVHQYLEPNHVENDGLRDFVFDASRFIKHGRDGVEEAPLQVYSSALVFTPEQSIVKQNFAGDSSSSAWVANHIEANQTWDANLINFTGHQTDVIDVKFSMDGQRVVSIDAYGQLLVWEATTGSVLWKAGVDAVCIDVSSDNDLACGDKMGNVIVWPKMEKRNKRVFRADTNSTERVLRVVFSDDASVLVWIGKDSEVTVWDTSSEGATAEPRALYRKQTPEPCKRAKPSYRLALAAGNERGDGRYIAAGGKEGKCITVWCRRRDKVAWIVTHTIHSWCVDLPNTQYVEVALLGASHLISWNVAYGEVGIWVWRLENQTSFEWRPSGAIKSGRIAHVPGTSIVIAPTKEGSLGCYDFGTDSQRPPHSSDEMQLLKTLERSQDANDLCLSVDGSGLVAILGEEEMFALWDVHSAQRIAVSRHPQRGITHYLSPNGGQFLAIEAETTIHMYDCALLRQSKLHDISQAGEVLDMQYHGCILSPDGRFVAALRKTRVLGSVLLEVWSTTDPPSSEVKILSSNWGPDTILFDHHRGLMFSASAKWVVAFAKFPGDGTSTTTSNTYELQFWNLHLHADSHQSASYHFKINHWKPFYYPHLGLLKATFSKDSRLFSYYTDAFHLIDLEAGQQVQHPLPLLARDLVGVTCMDDNIFLAATTIGNEKVRLFKYSFHKPLTQSGPDVQISEGTDSLEGLAYSTSRKMIAIVDRSFVQLLDASNTLVAIHGRGGLAGYLIGADVHPPSFCNDGCCLRFGIFGFFPLDPPRPGQRLHTPATSSIAHLPNDPWLFYQGRPSWWLPAYWRDQIMCVAGTVVLFQPPHGARPQWLRFHDRLGTILLSQPVHDDAVLYEVSIPPDQMSHSDTETESDSAADEGSSKHIT